jgi:hypothetical protein
MVAAVAGMLAALTQLGVVEVRSPVVAAATTVQAVATTAGSTPVASSAPTPAEASKSLADLLPLQSTGLVAEDAEVDLNGRTYQHSLLFTGQKLAGADYHLGHHYQRLKVTLGVPDTALTDGTCQFAVFLDNKRAFTATTSLGHPISLDLNVAGTTSLHIEVTASGSNTFLAAWGTPRLIAAGR